MIHYKVLYQIVIYLIQLVLKKLVKQQYLNDVRFKTNISFKKNNNLYYVATDYLAQLNKEKLQLSIQLESRKKETFCLRAVQKLVFNFCLYFLIEILIRTYEDILEMNINSSKNASASIDDEQKFQVVCQIFFFFYKKKKILN
jgi:hypothetical protein